MLEAELFEIRSDGIRDMTRHALSELPQSFRGYGTDSAAAAVFRRVQEALERNPERFAEGEEDEIRSAALLCDGFLHACGRTRLMGHGFRAARLVEGEADGENVARLIRRHHPSRRKASDQELFLQACVLMAETSMDGYEECRHDGVMRRGPDPDLPESLRIVREMTDGEDWDGELFVADGAFAFISGGVRHWIPDDLIPAFRIIGGIRAQKAYRRPSDIEILHECESFLRLHP